MTPDVKIVVPAKPDYVRLLRAVTVGSAARLEFTYDRIEDLRLAVSEACATLLALPWDAEILVLRLFASDSRITAVVCSDADPGADAWPPFEPERTLAWRVLSGLTDTAAFEVGEEGPAVRLEMEVR
ncbi:MAG: ATP-binding protein [Actinomycetota bacterium]